MGSVTLRSVRPASSDKRFHEDSTGRRFDLVQRGGRADFSLPWDHPWVLGKLVWVCRACGGTEPVRYGSFVHDEVIVPDPAGQLDLHDCDAARVRQVMES